MGEGSMMWAGLNCFKTNSVIVKLDRYCDNLVGERYKKHQNPKVSLILKAYLGLLGYYGKFIPNLAHTIAPLYRLLGASTPWQWTFQEQNAFEASKELLAA